MKSRGERSCVVNQVSLTRETTKTVTIEKSIYEKDVTRNDRRSYCDSLLEKEEMILDVGPGHLHSQGMTKDDILVCHVTVLAPESSDFLVSIIIEYKQPTGYFESKEYILPLL